MKKIPPRTVAHSFKRVDPRGLFVEIVNEGPWESVIHGRMKKDARMGDHYHRECRAFFYIMRGSARVKVQHLVDNTESEVILKAEEGMYFLPFETHSVSYLEESDFILLKSYRYKEESPDIFPHPIQG